MTITPYGIFLATLGGASLCAGIIRFAPMARHHMQRGMKDWPTDPDDATDDELKIVGDTMMCFGLGFAFITTAVVVT